MAARDLPGGYAKGRVRREAIVDAATELLADGGYARAPLSKIAEGVGITEGGLLHHFPSRMHLLLAVLDRRLARTAEWWGQADNGDDPVGLMRRIISTGAHIASEPGLIELFVQASAEAADPRSRAHALYAERYAGVIDSAAGEIAAAVEAGYFRADIDPVTIAREIIAVSDGLQLQWVLSDGSVDVAAGIRQHAIGLAERVVAAPHRALIAAL